MSELKATPGPWHPDRSGNRIYGIYGHSRGLRVNIINWLGIARPASEEGQANARLMLASRELYDAATNLLSLVHAHTGPDDAIATAAIEQAEAALKLARAET